MRVFSVSGYHHTGKTTTVINLINKLKQRGYHVVSVKDIHSEDFSMEKPGSNSWKHWEASRDVVFARGFKETYQIWHRRLPLPEILEHLNADYVVVEGMRSAALPRIICADSQDQLAATVDGTVFAISGKYANDHRQYGNLPVLHSERDIDSLTDLVEKTVFPVLPLADPECCSKCGTDCRQMVAAILSGGKSRNDCLADHDQKLILHINGRELKLVPFVQDLLKDTISAQLKHLKGYREGQIEIKFHE